LLKAFWRFPGLGLSLLPGWDEAWPDMLKERLGERGLG